MLAEANGLVKVNHPRRRRISPARDSA